MILLVDDDEDVRTMTRVNLTLEGFEVTEAVDGFDGLAQARAHRPDALVLDVMMPGRDGLDVLRQIRQDPTMGPLPIVVLTARADIAVEEEARAAGATAFLSKPFDIDDLTSTLRLLIAEASAAY
jgi:two-component system chemotaxis response regulator CheY